MTMARSSFKSRHQQGDCTRCNGREEQTFMRVVPLAQSTTISVYRYGENRAFSPRFQRPQPPMRRKNGSFGMTVSGWIVLDAVVEKNKLSLGSFYGPGSLISPLPVFFQIMAKMAFSCSDVKRNDHDAHIFQTCHH